MWSWHWYWGISFGIEWTESEWHSGEVISHFLINIGCLRIQYSEWA